MSLDESEASRLEKMACLTLGEAWRPESYTSPNQSVYPWMWLWDSCFHSIIWAALGDRRATTELETVFTHQTADGFVPHMGYQTDPEAARPLWGRNGASTITQPPMYGHTIRFLVQAGLEVRPETIDAAERGLDHLWQRRTRSSGLLVIVHPWESGCDDSPRWGTWMPEPYNKSQWDGIKRDLIGSLVLEDGVAVANPDFEVESVAFNALAAWNALELAAVTGREVWRDRAMGIMGILTDRWNGNTWVDGEHDSGDVETLEGLLPVLLGGTLDRDEAWNVIADSDRFGAPFGPRQTARTEAAYRPDRYWRGPAWPQLSYLIWVAARRGGRTEAARSLSLTTARGALESGFSEYWNPETGDGLGAVPQSWTGLAWVMANEEER